MEAFAYEAAQLLAACRTACEEARAKGESGTFPLHTFEPRRALQRLYAERVRNAVLEGCTFPQQPIAFSGDDAGLLNFGVAPAVLRSELSHLMAEQEGRPPPPPGRPVLSSGLATAQRRALARLDAAYSEEHVRDRVYNVEPWLQGMYRDCLDVDTAERVRIRIARLQTRLKGLAAEVLGLDLPAGESAEVSAAFAAFRRIIDRAHMLEHDRRSFSGRRPFMNAMDRIEKSLQRVEAYLAAHPPAHPPDIRGVFEAYKAASYELMRFNRRLRDTWRGEEIDEQVRDLQGLLDALLDTLHRCAEDEGAPQCSVLSVREIAQICPRQAVERAFRAILLHDVIGGVDAASARMEVRRYGPLSVLIAPGAGRARYAAGLLEQQDDRMARRRDGHKRDYDLARRSRYPVNLIVVPNLTPPERVLEHMCDAWLEYKSRTQPGSFRDLMESARKAFPEIFDAPVRTPRHEHHLRRTLGRGVAAFLRWAQNEEVEGDADLAAFVWWLAERTPPPALLVEPQHRVLAQQYRETAPEKREEVLAERLGERYALDRRILALACIRADRATIRRELRTLSSALATSAPVECARELLDDQSPHASGKLEILLLRFFRSVPPLATALAEVRDSLQRDETLLERKLAAAGRPFEPERVRPALEQRLADRLERERAAADRNVDHCLEGILHATDGNLAAAVRAFEAYLDGVDAAPPAAPPPAELSEAAFAARFGGRTEHIRTDPDAAGGAERSRAAAEPAFAWYNLGRLHLRRGERETGVACLERFVEVARQAGWRLLAMHAGTVLRKLAETDENAAGAPASNAVGAPGAS
ncbi:MAG: hypothetical protein ACOCX4_06065 [Planctomycetota bacterium]